MKAVEDESHFLLDCPKYANHRIKITNHLNNNTNFASQSYMSKFQWLLSNEDESVCKDIASFVTICFPLGIDDFAFTALLTARLHICPSCIVE